MSGDPLDAVFRALNDPSRRLLLDRLAEVDGQTVNQLCDHLPTMSRYGGMKHLGVLAAAGLIATERAGRCKYHYLNRVPIRELHDRWITPLLEPSVAAVASLQTHLEQPREGTSAMSLPVHVHEIHVRCNPQAVWDALTEGDQTVQYFHGTRVESTWEVGAPVCYLYDQGDEAGQVAADGHVLAFDEPRRLEISFHPHWDPALESEGPARTVWLIEAEDDHVTRVRVEYHDLDPAGAQSEQFAPGTVAILSGLKTLIETGTPLFA